jgi:hypothetical protein
MFSFGFVAVFFFSIYSTVAVLDQPISLTCNTQAGFNVGDWTHYAHLSQLLIFLVLVLIVGTFICRRCWPICRLFCSTAASFQSPVTPQHQSQQHGQPPYGVLPYFITGSSFSQNAPPAQVPVVSAPPQPHPQSSDQVV